MKKLSRFQANGEDEPSADIISKTHDSAKMTIEHNADIISVEAGIFQQKLSSKKPRKCFTFL